MQAYDADSSDVFLTDLPLFHIAAMYHVQASMATGASIAVRSRPTLTNYWAVARATGATMSIVLSSMVSQLLSQPERDWDRDHDMRLMFCAPLPSDVEAFKERFAIADIQTGYGSTEVPGCVNKSPGDSIVPGSCGTARNGFEVRLVDDNDIEVPDGTVGQAIVRTEHPWMLSVGYKGDAEATAAAWRNGWFHTGDLLRRDKSGNYYYVDRLKDAIRRRGENVSSHEVEQEVRTYPGVVDVACVGVSSDEQFDEEIKIWLVVDDRFESDCLPLVRYLADRMPFFMVPRYIEFVDSLPTTASARAKKFELRRRGNSPSTWDLESAGWRMSRNGLVRIDDRRD